RHRVLVFRLGGALVDAVPLRVPGQRPRGRHDVTVTGPSTTTGAAGAAARTAAEGLEHLRCRRLALRVPRITQVVGPQEPLVVATERDSGVLDGLGLLDLLTGIPLRDRTLAVQLLLQEAELERQRLD